jgi:hypothetical protein
MPAKPETALKRAILDGINRSGLAFVWRNQSGCVKVQRGFMHLAPKGSPDIVGWLLDGSGRFCGVEVKTPEGTTQKARRGDQAEWRDRMRAAGAVCGQVESVQEALALLSGAARARQAG